MGGGQVTSPAGGVRDARENLPLTQQIFWMTQAAVACTNILPGK
jgi:hypothetical protein